MSKSFPTALDGALFMAAKGFKLFPLSGALGDVKEAKVPRAGFTNWQGRATSDPAQLRKWYDENPLAGFGVHCSGYTLVDDDSIDGAAGVKALEAQHQEAFPETLVVRTQKGGRHHYLTGSTTNSVKALNEYLDTRSANGYSISPGTRFYGPNKEVISEYVLEHDRPLQPVPAWIVSALAENKRDALDVTEGVASGSRNETMIRMAGVNRAKGVGYEGIIGLLRGVNEEQTDEPLDDSELQLIARSAMKYEPKAALERLAFPEFCTAETHHHSAWGSDIDLEALKPTDWITRGRYVPGYLTVTGAPAGVGKSRVVMLEAIAVATGASICGHEVRQQGPVWYISEDPLPDMQERFAGVCKANNIDHKKVPILLTSLMDLPLRLIQKDGGKYLIDEKRVQWIEDKTAEGGIKLLILDPWKRFSNCEENDNSAADALCAVLQRIASRGKCAVGIVHHTGKAASKGDNIRGQMDAIRGASALAGAARVIWTIDHYRPGPDQGWNVPKDDERLWVRMDPAKCNLAPLRPSATLWYHLTSVRMAHHVHPEDSVGVAKLETPERAQAVVSTEGKVEAIKKVMGSEERIRLGTIATTLLKDGGCKEWTDDARIKRSTFVDMLRKDFTTLEGFDGFPFILEPEKVKGKERGNLWVVLKQGAVEDDWEGPLGR